MTADLQSDLDQASTTSVQLAPHARSTAVVSALELGESTAPKVETPKATPAPRAPERAKAPAPTRERPVEQVAAATPTPAPVPVAQTPAPVAEAPAPAPETGPSWEPKIDPTAPVQSSDPGPSRGTYGGRDHDGDHHGHADRGRRGGGWSVGDVIRNAPFPVNP